MTATLAPPQPHNDGRLWHLAKSAAGDAINGLSVVQVEGTEVIDDREILQVRAARQNAADYEYLRLPIGACDIGGISATGLGWVSFDWPLWVLAQDAPQADGYGGIASGASSAGKVSGQAGWWGFKVHAVAPSPLRVLATFDVVRFSLGLFVRGHANESGGFDTTDVRFSYTTDESHSGLEVTQAIAANFNVSGDYMFSAEQNDKVLLFFTRQGVTTSEVYYCMQAEAQ